MTRSWAIFVAISLLWQSIESQDWNSGSSLNGILVNHVIKNLTGVTSFITCIRECDATSDCESINMYTDKAKCELNDATHLSYPNDFIPETNQHNKYMLYSNKIVSECSNQLCGDPEVCLVTDGISHQCYSCNESLGMEDGRITNDQITALTTWNSAGHEAWRARLHFAQNAWVSGRPCTVGDYLQVDLGKTMLVSKIALQGRPYDHHWVTRFYLEYSRDGVNFLKYKYRGVTQEFPGSTDRFTVVMNKVPMSAVIARYIRIVVLEWSGHISIRTELYGCAPPVEIP